MSEKENFLRRSFFESIDLESDELHGIEKHWEQRS